MEKNITRHISQERFARMEYIIDTIGLGDSIVLERITTFDNHGTHKVQITNTGVMLIRSIDNNRIITAWIASIDQVTKVSRECGQRKVPDSLYRRVVANKKYCKNQP